MARDWSKLGTEAWGSKEGTVFQEGTGAEILNCVGDLWATAGEILLADFIALAKNAWDVMIRRGWHPRLIEASRQWVVELADGSCVYRCQENGGDGLWITAADPFTALIEADQWHKENVEKETLVR